MGTGTFHSHLNFSGRLHNNILLSSTTYSLCILFTLIQNHTIYSTAIAMPPQTRLKRTRSLLEDAGSPQRKEQKTQLQDRTSPRTTKGERPSRSSHLCHKCGQMLSTTDKWARHVKSSCRNRAIRCASKSNPEKLHPDRYRARLHRCYKSPEEVANLESGQWPDSEYQVARLPTSDVG
jgi:hypothetical protein